MDVCDNWRCYRVGYGDMGVICGDVSRGVCALSGEGMDDAGVLITSTNDQDCDRDHQDAS